MTIFIFQVSSERDCGGGPGDLSVLIVLLGRLSPPWRRLPTPPVPRPRKRGTLQSREANLAAQRPRLWVEVPETQGKPNL